MYSFDKDLPLAANFAVTLAHIRSMLTVSAAALSNLSAHFKDYRVEDPFAAPTWESDDALLSEVRALLQEGLDILRGCEKEVENIPPDV